MERPASSRPVEHPEPDPLRARFPRILVTGAGGQLGTALSEAFPWASALPRERLDIRNPLDETRPGAGSGPPQRRLDEGRRRRDRRGLCEGGQRPRHSPRRRARRAARLLLDRLRLRRREARALPRVGPARPALRLRTHEARRRAGDPRRLDRAQLLALRLDGHELRPHDARTRTRARRGARRRRPAGLSHVRRPPGGSDARARRPAVRHLPRCRGR